MNETCWCGKTLVESECPEHGADCEWPMCTSALTTDIGGSRSCDIGGPHWVEAKICRSCPVWRVEAALRAIAESDWLRRGSWGWWCQRCQASGPSGDMPTHDENCPIGLANAALAAMEVKGG